MTTFDMTESIAPKSDQANADDFMSGPRTFTIAEVRKSGSPDQPVDVILAEFPHDRPFKPSKSMRRVMVAVWGSDASSYAGKRLTLYRDATVKWGGQAVGGIRISHMSGLDKPMTLALTETRGKRVPFIVEPLPDSAPTSPAVSPEMLADLIRMFDRKGIPAEARLSGVNRITGGSATDLKVITEAEASKVLAALASRPNVTEPEPADEEPTLDTDDSWPTVAGAGR